MILSGDVEVFKHVGEKLEGRPLGRVPVPTLEHYLHFGKTGMFKKQSFCGGLKWYDVFLGYKIQACMKMTSIGGN